MTAILTAWNAAAGVKVTEPGVYDIPADVYHADPVPEGSLSVSGARKLLPPHCPAIYKHELANGRPPKRDFDFGHAAHKVVLGAGAELVVIEADDYRTKDARTARDAAYAAGHVPVLPNEFAVVTAMAEAIRKHPLASRLLSGEGAPEQAMFWRDKETGVWRRAMADWLPAPVSGKRFMLSDFKTCVSASPQKIEKFVWDYGYHQQAAWYLDGIKALGIADSPKFLLIFQEKTVPYLVTVAELTALTLEAGTFYNRKALRLYAECRETGRWPGYANDEVAHISLPAYAQNQYFQESN